MMDATRRFSSRVDNYIKYRPGYPWAIIETLRDECQLAPSSIVADIGSGSGILTELFLRNGNTVYAVEPNREMREAGERLLASEPGFHSIAGRAEHTTLADCGIDFVVAGQAFHWFEREKARDEFLRILKPSGWAALAWNKRETQSTPFLAAYEELLQRRATDYIQVDHRQIDEAILADFFGSREFQCKSFANRQVFNYAGLQGRLLSSSYTPEAGHPNYEPMLQELAEIFRAYQENGQVTFEYKTVIYLCHPRRS